MYDTFKHNFRTERGLLIFVPTKKGREDGEKIIRAVLKRWTPHEHFFHFQRGGHVAASLIHLPNNAFARLDIKSFFHSVSRSKILSNGEARITEGRIKKFAAVERTAYGLREWAIVRYVQGINPEQAEELKTIYGAASERDLRSHASRPEGSSSAET
jgi:hypothetical protein